MPHSLQQGSLRAKLPSPSAPDRRSAAERSEVRRKAVGFQFQPERLSMQSSPSQCPHPKSSFPFRPHPATKFPEYPVYELPGRTNFLVGGYQNFIFTGPARPTLFGEQHDSQALLSWSTLAKECQLEYCDVLLPQQIWVPVTNSPSILGTNFTVALPATNLTRMFRLAVLNVR